MDNPASIGMTVNCIACHNEATVVMDSVVFPSGIEVTGLGASARCMQCHQGRESSVSVDTRIADANVPDDDTVSSALSFRNVHYLPAGATQLGAEAMGGSQYPGKSYDVKFAHVEGIDSCIDCHDQHSLEVKVEICSACHEGVNTHKELESIRFTGSTSDYDGDGDVAEGIHEDTNGNGVIDEGEDARFRNLTARLYRAYYNYIYVVKWIQSPSQIAVPFIISQ